MTAESNLLAIEAAAHSGAFGENQLKTPTDAQAISGNYKKGRINLHGLPIAIEQPRGTYRTGIDAKTGKRWTSRMAAHYGYFERTKGNDGDGVDCFIGFYPQSELVFVINQFVKGSFDEHKVLLCYPDEDSAKKAYLDSYERGWNGMHSIIQLSVSQLKWWLKHGNMRTPLNIENLPPEGLETMTRRLQWNSDALPYDQTIDQVLYDIRRADAEDGLLLDAVSLSDILEEAEGVMTFDALVTPYAKLQRKMELLNTVLERTGEAVKPISMQISDPFKQNGTAQVAVVFELSDGQTVSIYLHNPDVTPAKIAPQDELISWKWLLNKKDISIVVAPERGEDLNVREVARRIMKLAEKNSAAFQRANGKRAERMALIATVKDEIVTLEAELKAAQNELEVAKVEAESRPVIDWTKAKNLDSQESIRALGVAAINDVGNENVYVVKDGKPYYFKPVNTDNYAVGEHDFSNDSPYGETELPATHYSDIILSNLVENFGWERSEGTGSVKKNVGGGAVGGELNPTGVRIVTAIFDEPARRYLTLQSGWDNVFSLDCRDKDPKEAAEEFDSKVRDWANGSADKGAEVKEADNKVSDLSYFDDGLFTLFIPNTKAGEVAWNDMAKETDGTGKVLSVHADSVISQLRASGYTVTKGKRDTSKIDPDALLKELGIDAEIDPTTPEQAKSAGEVNKYFAASYFIDNFMGGVETSVLVQIIDGDRFSGSTVIEEKLITSGAKSAITRFVNEAMAKASGNIGSKYIYAASLRNGEAAELLKSRGYTITDENPIEQATGLVQGKKYDVAIANLDGSPQTPLRFYVGAEFRNVTDASKGKTNKFEAYFSTESTAFSLSIPKINDWLSKGLIKEHVQNDTLEQDLINAYVKSLGVAADKINAAIAGVQWGSIVNSETAHAEYMKLHSEVESVRVNITKAAGDALFDVGIPSHSEKLNFLKDTPEYKAHDKAIDDYRALDEKIRSAGKNAIIEAGKAEFAALNADSSIEDMAKAIYRKKGIDIGNGSSGYLTNLTTAIQNKDAEYLRGVLGNKENVASAELFTMVTGIKLASTQRDTLKQIDEWAGITPEQREATQAAKDASRAQKNVERDVKDTWNGLAHGRVRSDDQDITTQQYVTKLYSEGYTVLDKSKKGSATIYGVKKEGDSGLRYINNKSFNSFMKAAFAFGGLKKSLDFVGAVIPEAKPKTPVEVVNDAYKFANASDDFKTWLSEYVGKETYSPFVTAKKMDIEAARNGASIEWGMFGGATLDSVRLAVSELERARDVVVNNAPINAAEGDIEQAALNVDVAQSIDEALEVLSEQDDEFVSEDDAGIATEEFTLDNIALDGVDQDGYVGKIKKNGDVVGRIDIGGDGKAMVFVGASGDVRVKASTGQDFHYSDDDAEDMVNALLNETKSGKSNEFNYQLLGRLKSDCEYFLGAGNGGEKHLWAGNVIDQIAKMKELFDSLPANGKPEWLTMSDILKYENDMLAKLNAGNDAEAPQVSTDEQLQAAKADGYKAGGNGDGKRSVPTTIPKDQQDAWKAGVTQFYDEQGAAEAFVIKQYDLKKPDFDALKLLKEKFTGTYSEKLLSNIDAILSRNDQPDQPAPIDEIKWKNLKTDILGSISAIASIDKGMSPGMDRSLFVSSIAGKIRRSLDRGELALAGTALAFVAVTQEALPKPVFAPSNKLWSDVDWKQFAAQFAPAKKDAAPAPAPTEPTTGNPQMDADKALYQSVIDATAPNMLDPDLADQLEAAYYRHAGNSEMDAMFELAVNAYQASMLAATSNIA